MGPVSAVSIEGEQILIPTYLLDCGRQQLARFSRAEASVHLRQLRLVCHALQNCRKKAVALVVVGRNLKIAAGLKIDSL